MHNAWPITPQPFVHSDSGKQNTSTANTTKCLIIGVLKHNVKNNTVNMVQFSAIGVLMILETIIKIEMIVPVLRNCSWQWVCVCVRACIMWDGGN